MTIMESIKEKFDGLTAEQKEQYDNIKDAAEFKAFVSETGITLTAEETALMVEMYETGKLSLSDDELDSVAGGWPFRWPFGDNPNSGWGVA